MRCINSLFYSTKVTAIAQANLAAAAVLKPRFTPGALPTKQVRVIIAQQEGLDRVWFQDEGVEEESLNLQTQLQEM